MHKNFYKILFIFLLFISNLQASKQSENINFQEQINSLKIEIAVLKSKQEFYDKKSDDKSQIISIENQLKNLETKLNENKQDTKVFDVRVNSQDKRIGDINFYLVIYGVIITILLFLSSLATYKISLKENKENVDEWLKKNKDEIINPIKEEANKWADEILKEQQEELKKHNIEDSIDKKYEDLLEKVEEKLERKEEDKFTFDDWDSKATHEYYNGIKEKSLEYLKRAIKLDASHLDITNTIYKMGLISYELKDTENAIKYYKMAIEKEHIISMNNLANIYTSELNDTENAIKYYKMAIEKNYILAMYNLAILYLEDLQDNENAIKYYKMAIEKKHIESMNNLGNLYKNQLKDNENAIKYYKMAIEKDYVDSMFNMAILYGEDLQDNENAIKYYKMAIEKEDIGAMKNLAFLYKDELKDTKNADKYFKMAKEYEKKTVNK